MVPVLDEWSSGVVPVLDEWSSGVVHCSLSGTFSVSLPPPNLCFQQGSLHRVRRDQKQFCCNVDEFERYASGNFVAVLQCKLRSAMFS